MDSVSHTYPVCMNGLSVPHLPGVYEWTQCPTPTRCVRVQWRYAPRDAAPGVDGDAWDVLLDGREPPVGRMGQGQDRGGGPGDVGAGAAERNLALGTAVIGYVT